MEVRKAGYLWSWVPESDQWSVRDSQGRRMAAGQLRPQFLLPADVPDQSWSTATVESALQGNQLVIRWQTPEASITMTWTFHDCHFALSPLIVTSPSSALWSRLEYFSGMTTHYALLPGLSMSSFIGPVVDLHSKLRLTTTLGAGAMRGPGLAQQWGLPSHYFAVYDTASRWNAADARSHESDALCVGLASLPQGDFWVRTGDRCLTPILNLRSDLWNLYPAGQTHQVGLDLLFFVGRDLTEAPRAWYRHLAGLGHWGGSAYPQRPSPRGVREWTMFNTWGSQVAEPIQPEQLNLERLNRFRDGLIASKLPVRHFVVDDKWEGHYGVLQHDEHRFPGFEAWLDDLRQRGLKVGLWAAFLRCEDPTAVGLTEDHLMKGHDGQVLWLQHQTARYGIYDITQERVAEVLARLAAEFMRRYRPDLIKFDFGYELPTLDVSLPADPQWRGERLIERGLQVLLGAMKAVNPELVVMYYGLSPLLARYYDLHSTDDMVYCPRDYDWEGNRRMVLASLLGEVGMPTSSSTGYDWATAPSLWFDSVAVGVPGSLLTWGTDEAGGSPSPADVARFSGLAAVARPAAQFSVVPLNAHPHGGARAMTAGGWARSEGGTLVLLALRPGCEVAGLTFTGQGVVASLDDQSWDATRHLGVVPFGAFRLAWTHQVWGRWTQIVHRLDGTRQTTIADVGPGPRTLSWEPDGGSEVTWIECFLAGGGIRV